MTLITARKKIDTNDVPTEVSRIEGRLGETATIVLAAGATNGMLITITVKDGFGNAITTPRVLDLWFSGNASSGAVTAATYSGSLVASTGSIVATVVAAKVFRVVTNTSGVFAGTLTDTAKPATQYVVVKAPYAGDLIISAASGTSWG